MPTYDPQRSRSRPRAADNDAPAPVDEILGPDSDTGASPPGFHEPSPPEPQPPTAEPEPRDDDVAGPAPTAPSAPRVPFAEPVPSPSGGTAGLPREAFIGFAAAVLVIVALVLRRRRRRRGKSDD